MTTASSSRRTWNVERRGAATCTLFHKGMIIGHVDIHRSGFAEWTMHRFVVESGMKPSTRTLQRLAKEARELCR